MAGVSQTAPVGSTNFAYLIAGKPTDQSDSISEVLRDATVDTITNLACALEFPLNINKNNICISGKNGISTCNVTMRDLVQSIII